jgi:hypothetical protein
MSYMSPRAIAFLSILTALTIISLLCLVLAQAFELAVYLQIQG